MMGPRLDRQMAVQTPAVFLLVVVGVMVSTTARPCAQTQCQFLAGGNSPSVTIDNTSLNQLGRLFRNGVASTSTCYDPGPAAQITDGLNSFRYAEVYAASGFPPACVRVTITMGSCALYAAAYSLFTPSAPQANVLGQLGATPTLGQTSSFSFTSPGDFVVIVSGTIPGGGCPSFSVKVEQLSACRHPGFDRQHDGRADQSVYRPASGIWYSLGHDGSVGATSFGASTDTVVPGSYDTTAGPVPFYSGTGRSHPGVYRPSTSVWYTLANGIFSAIPWGLASDVPLPNTDFNGDGRADRTVFRPSSGTWYARSSLSDETVVVRSQQFGQGGDIPLVGDFDADFITDHAIARPNAGVFDWYILKSNFGGVMVGRQFGLATDKPVPADYDGDGRTDIAVWRPSDGTWYFLRSRTGTFGAFQFGALGDVPQPADLNGDRVADFVVFRQSPTPGQTLWYAWLSGTNTLGVVQWGQQGDLPVTAQNRIP